MQPAADNIYKYQYIILISIVFYRLNDCLSKVLTSDLGTFEILFYRSLFTLALIPLYLMFKKVNVSVFFEKYNLLRNVLAAVALFFEVASLEYLSLSTFILLLYSVPIFIKIFARIFLGESISKVDIFVISVSIFGQLFVFEGALENESLLGVVYALSGAVTYALSCIVTKKIKDPGSNSIYVSYVVVLFLISLLKVPSTLPSQNEMFILLGMAIFHIAAFLLYLEGFLHLKSSRAAVLEYSGLIFALIFDFAFWHNLPQPGEILGGVIIFVASLISIYREQAVSIFHMIYVTLRQNAARAMPQTDEK